MIEAPHQLNAVEFDCKKQCCSCRKEQHGDHHHHQMPQSLLRWRGVAPGLSPGDPGAHQRDLHNA